MKTSDVVAARAMTTSYTHIGMRQAGGSPTLSAPQAVIRKGEAGASGLPPQVIEKAHRVAEDHRKSVARAVDAGVRIAMGTDSGVGIHGENLEELSSMADAGMSLEQVLAATTSVAGELITPEHSVGRLAPHYLADAVDLNGRLESAEQLPRLRTMIGQVYKDGELQFPA
ncbi:amidohydrolase family protein [Arthrobacter sp. H5]|uniref:amidohydrolase family protein n=1 Tax=Arthrobacter sp. H5 TaxID=1267973 RepID=UPI0020A65363|nr:amidohydrolase family protein [Arthrobacter sp. H5]